MAPQHHRLAVAYISILLAGFAGPGTARAAEPSFTRVGFFPTAVSADGRVVVGYRGVPGSPDLDAIRWTAEGGAVSLGHLSFLNFAMPRDVSADGSVVVGYADNAGGGGLYFPPERPSFDRGTAFRWTAAEGMTAVAAGATTAEYLNQAVGVSADGRVIVGNSRLTATRWTAADGLTPLHPPSGIFISFANAVSADGAVAVGSKREGTEYPQAFRWTAQGGMLGLGGLPGFDNSEAVATSADGSVIAGHFSTIPFAVREQSFAFRWTESGGMVPLGVLPGLEASWPNDVSADGQVIVGGSALYSETAFAEAAFIWDPANGLRNLQQVLNELGLNPSGSALVEATAVSADGRTIVGGDDYGMVGTGWIATIPEPATLPILLAAGFVARRAPAR